MRPTLLPADTSLDAAKVYYAVLRRLGPEGRASKLVEIHETLGEVCAAGVRHRHPDYTPEQVRLALIRLRLGRELFQRAYGFDVRP